MITITKNGQFDLPKSFICIALTMIVTWQTLAATRNFVRLKELSFSEAQELASKIDSKIPIEINGSVLKWLNYFMVDPNGKAYMIKSVERMHKYKKFLSQKLKDKKMPLELLAVPFMESGYDNSLKSSAGAAGIWSFIPNTARNYGLVVNDKLDERLNVDKLTNAAISYYTDLINVNEFDNDWRLALIAYNSGEVNLKSAIRKQGTKNPWAFNNLGDKEYLAKIIAGIILLKNPDKSFLSNPLKFGKITNKFGIRGESKRFHGGLDIGAKYGTPILAPLAGVVKEAKFTKGHGKSIIIDHGNNIITRYSHVQKISVKKGQKVNLDQEVATVGSPINSSVPHLHFELTINGKSVDPEIFL